MAPRKITMKIQDIEKRLNEGQTYRAVAAENGVSVTSLHAYLNRNFIRTEMKMTRFTPRKSA